MVMGWLRPIVLVPAGVLTGLPPQQVDALIAHELSHIQRHDVLVGWIQVVAETLLFYHPAVWWVSRQLRIEREHCCDDRAVAVCRDRLTYARALTTLATQRTAQPAGALAASDGSLLTRIRRLVKPASTPSTRDRMTAALALGAVLAVLGGRGRLCHSAPCIHRGHHGPGEHVGGACMDRATRRRAGFRESRRQGRADGRAGCTGWGGHHGPTSRPR
jgi:beta-lactamase regulating signal transducer with metallopeptidase domain